MTRYIIRRILQAIPILLYISVVVCCLRFDCPQSG
jgi:ABC-type dipeptide/oligopeptide/nickel transport system permease component